MNELRVSIISSSLALTVAAVIVACTSQQAKTGADVAVRVADGICQEEGDAGAPDWVQLACQAEGVASPIVHVLLPRAEWHTIRARSVDAGPGK